MPIKPSDLRDPVVTFVTSQGVVEVHLLPQRAPVTVANFLSYVNVGFYDDVVFHRLFKPTGSGPAIVAQAGLIASSGDGSYQIRSPIAAPIVLESQTGLSNTLGTLAMARANAPDTAAAQFYFNTKDNAADFDFQNSANPGYAVFGRTQAGLDVLAAISQAPTRAVNAGSLGVLQDFPVTDVIIDTVASTQFFSGKRSAYTISASTDDISLTARKGGAVVSVERIDRLQFKDLSMGINEAFSGILATSTILGVARADGRLVEGGAGRDELFAAGRNNVTLSGGAGNDTLTGGIGADSFLFDAPLDARNNLDTVIGFTSGSDRLLLDIARFAAYAEDGALPVGDLVANTKPRATAVNHHLLYDTRKGTLSYDADGNGRLKAVAIAKLVGVADLDATDIALVDGSA